MFFNYVMIGLNDVVCVCFYFDVVLLLIGGWVIVDYMFSIFCYELCGGGWIWVVQLYDKGFVMFGNGNMVGLFCESEVEVWVVYVVVLVSGGSNEGDFGFCFQYGFDFYGVYVCDFDGNKMSFVYFVGLV